MTTALVIDTLKVSLENHWQHIVQVLSKLDNKEIFCGLGALGLILWWKWRASQRKRIHNVKTGLPPRMVSLLPTFYNFIYKRFKIGISGAIQQGSEKYGHTFVTHFFTTSVAFNKPDDVRNILKRIDDFEKAPIPPSLAQLTKTLFGVESILQQNNPKWHQHRSIMNKSFVNNKIFFEPLLKKATQCVHRWKTAEPVLVGLDLQKMTLDALGVCIFGKDFDSLNGNLEGPIEAYNYVLHNSITPLLMMFPSLVKLPLPRYLELKRKMKYFDSYCWDIINQAKKERDSNPTDQKPNLVSLLVNNDLEDNVVRDNIGVFFLAGHETTAATLNWAIYLLANYPQVTQKLRQEFIQKTQNFSVPLTFEDLKDMNYLDWFVKENMRFYPTVSVLTERWTSSDLVINDWFLPKHTSVSINIVSMLKDKSIWGDPEVFDPERWNPTRLTKEQRECNLPFSYGPRICIGMNFSLVEQKVFLYCLLKKFSSVKLAPGCVCEVVKSSIVHSPDVSKLSIQFA